MKRKCAITIPYNRCRLRRKNWKPYFRLYLEGETFEDLINGWELFVQELPGDEPVTNRNQKLFIVRPLGSASKDSKFFEEIVLDTNTVAEFKEKVNKIFGVFSHKISSPPPPFSQTPFSFT